MSLEQLIPWNWGKNGESLKKDSENPLSEFHKEMNRLFDNFSERMFGRSWSKRDLPEIAIAYPKMDVSETDKEFKVSAELPGMDEKDIEVSVSNEVLNIRGEKKAEKEEKKPNYYCMERSFGKFQRSIPLPIEVDKDQVKATFKKGVLNIVLPKSEKAVKDNKKIEVKCEG